MAIWTPSWTYRLWAHRLVAKQASLVGHRYGGKAVTSQTLSDTKGRDVAIQS